MVVCLCVCESTPRLNGIFPSFQGTIMELSDRVEILFALHHLPTMDMEHIITQAQSIRDEVRVRNLL